MKRLPGFRYSWRPVRIARLSADRPLSRTRKRMMTETPA
jgi:hypothetical protein